MRFISTKVHGYLDYVVGIALILPWIFTHEGPIATIPALLGITTIVYSIITDYEVGAVKLISMPLHLLLDFFSGALLAASPWLFDFEDIISIPFVVVGVFEIVVSLVTKLKPSGKPNEAQRQAERERKGAVTR